MKHEKKLQASSSKLQEQGVTLLMSIFIMATILVITLAVSYLAIQETRTSRSVFLSQPAISAAETGGEFGIWALKRSATLSDCDSITSTNLSNNSRYDACKRYGAATVELTREDADGLTFHLYNPNDINGDISLQNYVYEYLDVVHKSGSFSINVIIERLPTEPPYENGDLVASQAVAPGATVRIPIPAVPAGEEGRMKIKVSAGGNVTATLNTNRGMTDFPTIDSTGCSNVGAVSNCNNSELKRRVNITIPQ